MKHTTRGGNGDYWRFTVTLKIVLMHNKSGPSALVPIIPRGLTHGVKVLPRRTLGNTMTTLMRENSTYSLNGSFFILLLHLIQRDGRTKGGFSHPVKLHSWRRCQELTFCYFHPQWGGGSGCMSAHWARCGDHYQMAGARIGDENLWSQFSVLHRMFIDPVR